MTIDAATIHQSRATRFTLGPFGSGVSVQSLRGAHKVKAFYHRGHREHREEQLLSTAEDAEDAEACPEHEDTPTTSLLSPIGRLALHLLLISSASPVSSVVKALTIFLDRRHRPLAAYSDEGIMQQVIPCAA